MSDNIVELIVWIGFGLLGAAGFAVFNVTAKWQSEGIRPIAVNSIKVWTAALMMLSISFFIVEGSLFSVPIEATGLLALSVLIASIFGDTFTLLSQNRIGVSFSYPIVATHPIVTYVITILFLGEPFLLSKFLGVVLAVIGIMLVSRDQIPNTNDMHSLPLRHLDLIGMLFAILASIFLAIGGVIIQIGVVDIDPIHANSIRMVFGSIMMLPLFTMVQKRGHGIHLSRSVYMIVLASLFGWSLGSLSWVIIIKNMGATISSVLISTSPIFALMLSIKFLDEKITWKGIVGTFITIIGVWLVILGI